MNSWPIFKPQDSARELADHPHRLQLVHSSGLVYPALCPNCGDPASRNIIVEKVFRRASNTDTPDGYVIEAASPPYCDRCIAQHERELRILSWPQRVAVSLATGVTIAALGSGFMALLFLPDAVRDLAHPGFPWLLAMVLFFSLIAYASLSSAWNENAHRRVPPQTSVTLAFDFSASYAELLDTPRATYSIRNAAFAEAFMALNQERVWNPDSPAAKRTAHSRKLIYGVVVGLLVLLFLWNVAKDL